MSKPSHSPLSAAFVSTSVEVTTQQNEQHSFNTSRGRALACSVRQRFRRHYLPDDQPGEMKLAQDDATRICKRVVDHGMDTGLVAEQFEISRRRVQQLVKEYRETDEIPQLETPGRRPYAEYSDDLEERVLDLRQRGALAESSSPTCSVSETASRLPITASTRFFMSMTT